MKRFLFIVISLVSIFAVLYVIFEAWSVPLLSDPSPWLQSSNSGAGLIGVLLLVADVFLPVPSSLIMVAQGALYGVMGGTILSLIGTSGAFLVGYFVGQSGSPLVKRLIKPDEYTRTLRLLQKWGIVGIMITRPIPILSETTSLIAGAAKIPLKKAFIAALVGSVPAALLYAMAGAVSATFNNTSLVFIFVLVLTGITWFVLRRFDRFFITQDAKV